MIRKNLKVVKEYEKILEEWNSKKQKNFVNFLENYLQTERIRIKATRNIGPRV